MDAVLQQQRVNLLRARFIVDHHAERGVAARTVREVHAIDFAAKRHPLTAAQIKLPRGQPITVAGQAGILITIKGTDGHTQYSGATDFMTNYPILVELRQVQDFEGTVQWALGLSHGACYSYTFLTNPVRLVVYIQQ